MAKTIIRLIVSVLLSILIIFQMVSKNSIDILYIVALLLSLLSVIAFIFALIQQRKK